MTWTDKLAESGQKYVQNIVDQIPNERGERDAFVDLLDKLADGEVPQWLYLIVDEDGDVTGTDDEEIAKDYADNEDYICTVVDVRAGTNLTNGERLIDEALPIDDSPDDDD